MRALNLLRPGKLFLNQNYSCPITSLFRIKMSYAPINPSDIGFYMGTYGLKKPYPAVFGFQGSGTIISCQSSVNKQLLPQNKFSNDQHKQSSSSYLNKKVSVLANNYNGSYASQIYANLSQLIIWPDEVDLKNISMGWVNPITCFAFLQIIAQEKPQTVVISAVTSQLGRTLIRLINKTYPQITIISFSRNSKNDDQIKSFGATYILRYDDNNSELFKNKCVFFDAVGGEWAEKIFIAMPKHSLMICYGKIHKENIRFDPKELYFNGKTIKGFWLHNYLKTINAQTLQKLKQNVIINKSLVYQNIRSIYKLQNYKEAIRESFQQNSEGKILFNLQN